MNDAEKASLLRGMGAEPENPEAPEVGVDGKVAEEPEATQEQQGDDWNQLSDDQKAHILDWARGIYQNYTVEREGERGWDFEKIATEGGFDLVKKGAAPQEPEKTVADTNVKATEPDLSELLKKDPAAFIQRIKSEALEEARKEYQPIAAREQDRRSREMLTEVRGKHPDFDQYQAEISEIVTRTRPNIQSARDLELLYYAAKGAKGQATQPTGQARPSAMEGTAGRSAEHSSGGDPKSEADEAIERMLKAGAPNKDSAEAVQTLFGKGSLSPI